MIVGRPGGWRWNSATYICKLHWNCIQRGSYRQRLNTHVVNVHQAKVTDIVGVAGLLAVWFIVIVIIMNVTELCI